MKRDNLDIAVAEAKRFIARAEDLTKEQVRAAIVTKSTWIGHFPKESGALRRASMDLTRVLAALRSRE